MSVEFSDKQFVTLYRLRWNVETDFRSLKCALHAGILSCRTPEMIEKELVIHLLAYNLTRLLMDVCSLSQTLESLRQQNSWRGR